MNKNGFRLFVLKLVNLELAVIISLVSSFYSYRKECDQTRINLV